MQDSIIPLHSTFDPVWVELSSPGTQHGLPFYVVDIVEADGGRACMWCGTDHSEAMAAAADCAEGGLDAIDLTGATPNPLRTGSLH